MAAHVPNCPRSGLLEDLANKGWPTSCDELEFVVRWLGNNEICDLIDFAGLEGISEIPGAEAHSEEAIRFLQQVAQASCSI